MRATGGRHVGVRGGLLIAAVLVGILGGGQAKAVPAPPTTPTGWGTASEIDAFVQRERAELKLSGLAVVVLSEGSVIFDRTYGDAAPGGPAVTPDTPFVLGSTSKQFTGLAIQQLIAQGRLSLDDRVGALLRPLSGGTSPYADVSVAQLLSHTSGISAEAGTADEFDPAPGFTSLEAEARHLLQSSPASAPGTKFEYSNGNYTLLGSIIEQVTGTDFEHSLQDLVAGPLALRATTSDLAIAKANGLATGHYTWFGAIDSTIPGPRWPMGAPSAYTSSTAADLTRLLRAELGGQEGIDPKVIAADHAPLTTVDTFSKYASGWFVRPFWELHDRDENYDDPTLPLIYDHDGSTTRETSYLAFAPDRGLGVVVLSNTGLGTDMGRFGVFTNGLLHVIVGTQTSTRVVDPLVAAAPTIMVALPLVQFAGFLFFGISSLRPRRSGWGRWMPRIVVTLVTLVTVTFAFVVVPQQTHQPLLDRAWWAAVPDLAVSVAVSLVFAAACLALGVQRLVHALRARRERASAV
ncbi:serine hydrolase domain-containing protein [Lacisediminihabitans sp. FW035]